MIIYREKIDEEKKIYTYLDNKGNVITDKKILDYINSLPAIPPAYDNVEIFYTKSPKILFQGIDKKGRLQQIYSPKWRDMADKQKFKSLIDFGKKLPQIMNKITKNIQNKTITKGKLIAIILRIVTLCGFRLGSLKYQKLYGSVGLITIQQKHIKFKKNNSELHINFIGKKNMPNSCIITDPLIIDEIRLLMMNKHQDDFIFKYFDKQDKEYKLITANEINNWLKEFNSNFTSKFFRNFSVNSKFIEIIRNITKIPMTESQRKKHVKEILTELSCSINNTSTICKKSYLDPDLLKLYIEHPRKYKSSINDYNADPVKTYIKFLESVHL